MLVAFDKIAHAHIVVALDAYAALEAFGDFLGIVFEALERADVALENDDALSDDADLCAASYEPVGNHTARDLPDLRHVDDLADLGLAQGLLADDRAHKTAQKRLDIVNEIVDDVVGLNLRAALLGKLFDLARRTDVEAQDHAVFAGAC